jgi:hypothetical protein
MSIRHYGATFAVGAVLAIAAPVAQAHVADGTILSSAQSVKSTQSASTSSRATSATALKALEQRWVAIAQAYRLQQQDRFLSLRP